MFLETIQIWYWTDVSAISSCKFCIFWKMFCILSCCPRVFFKKKVTCPDWTCNYSKDKLTTLESKSFACIIYILPSKCCLVEKSTLAGKHHILHESTTETWDKTAVSRPTIDKIMHLEKTSTFCSELCTVSLWTCRIQVHTYLKDVLHALHNCCFFQSK